MSLKYSFEYFELVTVFVFWGILMVAYVILNIYSSRDKIDLPRKYNYIINNISIR